MRSVTRVDSVLRTLRDLPVADADAVGHPALVLAPHPDDESLGCGGLIAEQSRRGHPPFVLILTDGAGSHPSSPSHPPARLRAVREQEARDAVAILGLPLGRIGFLGLPDTAAPTSGPAFEAAAEQVAALCRREGVRVVLAPWQHDPHCDHEAAHLLAAAVCARLELPHLAYPVWGWTLPPERELPEQAITGFRLDVSRHMAAKRAAIQAHRSQYGGLITDDPAGFTLPRNLLEVFETPFETFLRVR